ncbi:MAG: hypothetical protein QOG64_2887 [Acidimicrobiaceae bacterium]|nr:hypothetical protein [Acidimicrobiaceae bacterium]
MLGAGGMVGLAYHAGVLRALETVGGYRPADADLIVGTSAGSVVGAYLRSGWSTEDFWQLAMGTHPRLEALGGEGGPGRGDILVPRFTNPVDLFRRTVGSSYVMTRSMLRLPAPRIPSCLQSAFPAGLFAMDEGRRRFEAELPEEWPSRPLWLCAVDIASGRRVVLGRRGSPPATLHEGVMSSCAIPGVYSPMRVGRLTLVDGGAHSSTNLDLAARFGCRLIIGVAPMAFDTAAPPDPVRQLIRRIPARALAGEVSLARRRGSSVLLLRPSAAELRRHGVDLMRPTGLDAVAQAAFDHASDTLVTPRFREALAEVAA